VSMEMFNIPRNSIREISFESRVTTELQPVYYKMKLDPKTGAWTFTDKLREGTAPDAERLGDLLSRLNFIKAESLLGRDSKTIEKFRLDPLTAPATLKLAYEIGEGKDAKVGEMELYISEDQANKAGSSVFYARLKDNLAVFQINTTL